MKNNKFSEISLVVPAHNSADVIAQTAKNYCILHSKLAGKYELIVVCNACTDDTEHIARKIAVKNRHIKAISIKERMKRALFVIVSAYLTGVVSLIPLYWAGAGLFKGFALTTIIGITAGVLITRPAFADIIKKLEE